MHGRISLTLHCGLAISATDFQLDFCRRHAIISIVADGCLR